LIRAGDYFGGTKIVGIRQGRHLGGTVGVYGPTNDCEMKYFFHNSES